VDEEHLYELDQQMLKSQQQAITSKPKLIPKKPEPPMEVDPDDCCGSGCQRCVYEIYNVELENYESALEKYEEEMERFEDSNQEENYNK